jgi:osmoprotectant transport system permease protein
VIGDVVTWLTDWSHWTDTRFDTGILTQLLAHIRFCGMALAIALVIALPLGLFIGHTGRFGWLVAGANALRALPTVGVLVLLTVLISPQFQGRTDTGFLIPTVIVLVLLAVPPILANTFSGVQNVDPGVRDAAAGMGMTGTQVLLRVELPISLPLIFSGVRSASLQLIATATVASYLPLGGLGRFIYDGLAQRDYPQMIGGGVLVAALALLTDLVLATIQRYVVSRGITGRFSTKQVAAPDSRLAAVTEAEGARA